MKLSLKAVCNVGLDFIDFLGDPNEVTRREELRRIYNEQFRNRDGVRDPNFSRVIFALRQSHHIWVKNGHVYINAMTPVDYGDQWQKPKKKKSAAQQVPNGVISSPLSVARPAAASFIPPPQPEPGSNLSRKRAKEIIKGLRSNRQQFISDSRGIKITSDHDITNGTVNINVDSTETTDKVKFFISNEATDSVTFSLYTLLCRFTCFSLLDEKKVTPACPLLLAAGDHYEVEVHFHSTNYGHFPSTLIFEFRPNPVASSKPLYITRDINASVSSQLAKALGPVAPYKAYAPVNRQHVHEILEEGEPPESLLANQLKQVVKLNQYENPAYLRDLVKQGLEDSETLTPMLRQHLASVTTLLESPLSMVNYSRRFQLLLHLEGMQMETDIKRYDLLNQRMTREHRLLVLRVPGVAENRPSVLRGDDLRVSVASDTKDPITVYKGYVHRVELDRVKLGFSKKLQQLFMENMKFNVSFTVNRFPLRLQHRAVNLAAMHGLGPVLFPTGKGVQEVLLPNLSLYDRKLEKNPEQYNAVQHIVSGGSRPAPYLVFGPPGTGKTVTIVEAIKQVRKLDRSSCILACAPSNSASDLLCESIVAHVDAHSVFRLYAGSRDPATIPEALKGCCNLQSGHDCFYYPPKEKLMEYKVVVTTAVTAGRLVSGGIDMGHFTHIFVDEAGHAVEPECLIGIAGLLSPGKGQLVLAGDPKQLGPVLRSPFAIRHGLGLSFLERLMRHNPLYQKLPETGQFDSRFVTKLLRNYRSHPAILKIPNELFYDGELQPFADEFSQAYCNWEHLLKQGFPLVFHGVMGKDEREANSPSFFNVTEVHILMDYLKKLLQTQAKKGIGTLSPKDVGIIAPYRKQVEKIRKAIGMELSHVTNIKKLKVGSVEEFQGQERRVILVSTVRSSASYIKMDEDFNLGFLSSEKRFNVAMTRAKALLIVVGNPVILNTNCVWKRFIQYCEGEGGYRFDCPVKEGEDELVQRLARLNIQHSEASSEESCIQLYVHPEWRNEQ